MITTSPEQSGMGHGAPTPRKPHSPFTGRPAEPGSVLAVKIDNVQDARPHTGVEHADIVCVERVEGGLSRLLAVYASHVPGEIGPVRSMREYNVEQLAVFRRPAVAYSGAQPGVEDMITASPLFARSHDAFPTAYGRSAAKQAPHNLYLTPDLLLEEVPDASYATDIGWRFSAEKPPGGKPAKTAAVKYPAAKTAFVWSQDEGRWLVSFDGEAAMNAEGDVQLGGSTVVIQYVTMRPSRYQDPKKTTPYLETVGSGTATVLRDGEEFTAYWERPCAEAGTGFWLPDEGERMTFAPGQVWLVYAEAEKDQDEKAAGRRRRALGSGPA